MAKDLFLLSNETHYQFDFDLESLFYKLAKQTFKLTATTPQLFSVTLVSHKAIREINKRYRNKDQITDVISFSFLDNVQNQFMLGDIYICVSRAMNQAKKYQHSFKREISFLFVHGLLHLLGYDHLNKDDEMIMFEYQDKILESCKIYR